MAAACFAAALLAKEEVAAFPLALALLPAGGKPDRNRARLWSIAVMLVFSFAAGLRTIYASAVMPGLPTGFGAGITPAKYFLAEGGVILRYLRLLVLPYGFTVDPDIQVPPVWLGVLAWLAVAALAWAAWRWSRWALAGLILLIPSSTVFPAADFAADRRLYLPLFALAAAAGIWLARLDRPRMRLAATAVVLLLVVLSAFRTEVWMTEQSLWSEAVRRAPQKVRPKIQLARALPSAQAIELLAEARGLAPQNAAIAAETGRILLSEGRADAALAEFGRALALAPRDARYLNNRGVALEALGQTEAARGDFERALRIDPNLHEARENLVNLHP